MVTPANLAAGAYAAAQRYSDIGRQSAVPVSSSDDKGSFADMLSSALDSVSSAGKKADSQAQQAVAGKSDLVDVVTAVSESEAALQTLVAVRDKVISAYEEIMKMPI
jgi:flagellar hook-basal body complex protein FliE